MGRLNLPNITCVDSFNFTFSTWFRVPTSGWNNSEWIIEGYLFEGAGIDSRITANGSTLTWKTVGVSQQVPYGGNAIEDTLLCTRSIAYDVWHHVICGINCGTGPKRFDTAVQPIFRLDGIVGNGSFGTQVLSGVSVLGSGICFGLNGSHTAFDGQAMNVPWLSAGALEMADFILWTDQFIDPSDAANFARFVLVSDGRGYPVNPQVAVAAYGTPAILLQGKASDSSFYFNRGNCGSFTKVGTASDFTPTPSYI